MSSPPESGYLYGRHTVLTLLGQTPERVTKLYLAKDLAPDRRVSEIRRLAKEAGIVLMEVPRPKLASLLADQDDLPEGDVERVHQGVVACVAAVPLLSVPELLAKTPTGQRGLILMLDGVTDPRNLGALLRVADAAGAVGVIIPKHRSATLSPTVGKTACGAETTLPVAMATNLRQALEQCQQAGYWSVAALCGDNLPSYTGVKFDMSTVLVLGNEETGVGPALARACDFQVTIPQYGQVASLNVSCAAAVLAFHIAQQQRSL